MEVKVGAGEREYFNGSIRTVETQSSVLISSSRYLNNGELRTLIAQEMLRRNGPDLPNTAYIPEVAQLLMTLEDFGRIMALFEEEKARLPKFREWCDNRALSDFKKDDVKDCEPGTLGNALYTWMTTSGYELDLFYREIQVVNDFTFYLRQTAVTHDIEHLVTGFGPNHGGEVALLTAATGGRLASRACPSGQAGFGSPFGRRTIGLGAHSSTPAASPSAMATSSTCGATGDGMLTGATGDRRSP